MQLPRAEMHHAPPQCRADPVLQGGWDWMVLSYFVGCGVSRLARYNVTAESLSGESGKVKVKLSAAELALLADVAKARALKATAKVSDAAGNQGSVSKKLKAVLAGKGR